MIRIRTIIVAALFVTGLILPASVNAYDLPAVNLGFTSFLDGGPPAGPGFYFTQYFQYYTSSDFNDADGDELPLPDPELDVLVSLSQFIYQSNQAVLLGGKWGIDVIIPIVYLNSDYGQSGPFPEDNGTGIGDILIGPFFFSFNPYWAATAFITPKLTASVRLHYLWNAVNNDPNRNFVGADDTQAGQAVHGNFALGYEVLQKRLRVGANAYYLKQFTETKVDGDDVPDSEEEVFGIGPGMVYHFSQEQHVFANLFFETMAENRTEGTRFTLRYVHHF
jgi:anthranilate 1,2-dioxygenase (deaminating, decarboxylating) large subunit